MQLSEDIARNDGEPEAAEAAPTSEPRAERRPRRGHHPKIAEAVAELQAEGLLVANMRPGIRNYIINERLKAKGHGPLDRPSRRALGRHFE